MFYEFTAVQVGSGPYGNRIWIDALRIMAPQTPERASFEKYGRSNTRTVMHSKTLDIKNDPLHWSQLLESYR
jgi:hypothetical protein